MKTISFHDFESNGENCTGWYDKKKKSMIDIDPGLTQTPVNVYLIEVPGWDRIDPIGKSRTDTWFTGTESNDVRYINDIPMVVNPTATFKHISETSVAKIIRDNRRKQGLPAERVVVPKTVKVRYRGL
ncbi:hypothetical protein [Chitinophaga filiformis]|uniref:Uncharacterized protein n=1 Tax=Chitinophaga filiformis TaxID=104663 RepID=A0ABY4I5M9_CHIFI|nr:hypothetical protein [Chitinophaga filiformis]UPK71392.1 hypothetical protein MYF79_08890 [Chitinophaga filiformis]